MYGFIAIPSKIIFDLINHRYFQRLRRISQLGLTYLVYPGARHTRFEHTLGAMHLTGLSLRSLQSKGIDISPQEYEATLIAMLLHDIGHGPFSHTLEKTIIPSVHHEQISLLLMRLLAEELGDPIPLAIQIFQDTYPKKFLHQLVSSQLDMDRMDYLNRDSFFSGVTEGVVNYDRIINKLNVSNDQLVVELKGIYSVEKFITARRLMYWQVYLHKTTVGADHLITQILARAKFLTQQGLKVSYLDPLHYFLMHHVTLEQFSSQKEIIERFVLLDDFDVISEIKRWIHSEDLVLSSLCKKMIYRDLWTVVLNNDAGLLLQKEALIQRTAAHYQVSTQEASYLCSVGSITHNAYHLNADNIKILFQDGTVKDITQAADLLNISALTKPVEKYFVCFDKAIGTL